jgi:hypothetical protein
MNPDENMALRFIEQMLNSQQQKSCRAGSFLLMGYLDFY